MPTLPAIRASNALAATALPPKLVAVFTGATAGIGAMSMREFARRTTQPRIYFIGRSQTKADKLLAELKTINPGGEYVFLPADLSLLKEVDEICEEIMRREKSVNVLYMTQGGIKIGAETSEGIDYMQALAYYSRIRLALNLLPLVARASRLRRIISMGMAGKEGRIDMSDLGARHISFFKMRPHCSSMMTLALMAIADWAVSAGVTDGGRGHEKSNVSFIHTFPGLVTTDLIRGDEGFIFALAKWVTPVAVALGAGGMDHDECGARQMYPALSARFPDALKGPEDNGLSPEEGLILADGVEGVQGGGVYSVGVDGESTGEKITKLMRGYRADGTMEKLWTYTLEELKRSTGQESIVLPRVS